MKSGLDDDNKNCCVRREESEEIPYTTLEVL